MHSLHDTVESIFSKFHPSRYPMLQQKHMPQTHFKPNWVSQKGNGVFLSFFTATCLQNPILMMKRHCAKILNVVFMCAQWWKMKNYLRNPLEMPWKIALVWNFSHILFNLSYYEKTQYLKKKLFCSNFL